jgi:hypothetical protein
MRIRQTASRIAANLKIPRRVVGRWLDLPRVIGRRRRSVYLHRQPTNCPSSPPIIGARWPPVVMAIVNTPTARPLQALSASRYFVPLGIYFLNLWWNKFFFFPLCLHTVDGKRTNQR